MFIFGSSQTSFSLVSVSAVWAIIVCDIKWFFIFWPNAVCDLILNRTRYKFAVLSDNIFVSNLFASNSTPKFCHSIHRVFVTGSVKTKRMSGGSCIVWFVRNPLRFIIFAVRGLVRSCSSLISVDIIIRLHLHIYCDQCSHSRTVDPRW